MYASIKLPKKEKRRNWHILKRSMRKSIILVISNQQSTSTQSSCRDKFGGFSFFPREDFANTLLHRDLQQPLLPYTQLMLRRFRRGRGIFSIFTLNLDLCHKATSLLSLNWHIESIYIRMTCFLLIIGISKFHDRKSKETHWIIPWKIACHQSMI